MLIGCVYFWLAEQAKQPTFTATPAHTENYIPFHGINFLIKDTLLLVHIADHRSYVTNYHGEYENS